MSEAEKTVAIPAEPIKSIANAGELPYLGTSWFPPIKKTLMFESSSLSNLFSQENSSSI